MATNEQERKEFEAAWLQKYRFEIHWRETSYRNCCADSALWAWQAASSRQAAPQAAPECTCERDDSSVSCPAHKAPPEYVARAAPQPGVHSAHCHTCCCYGPPQTAAATPAQEPPAARDAERPDAGRFQGLADRIVNDIRELRERAENAEAELRRLRGAAPAGPHKCHCGKQATSFVSAGEGQQLRGYCFQHGLKFTTVQDAAAAPPAQAAPEWRPISTAPRDGTRVIVFYPLGSKPDSVPARWDGRYWILDDGASIVAKWQPTHWMPLPAPPTAAEKDAAKDRARGEGDKT